MKVLVTGGAGFIGGNLCHRLLADGVQVRVLDNFATGRRENVQGLDVELVEGDVANPNACVDALRGMDSVVHLAALPSVPRSIQDPVRSHIANATGSLNVLEAARGVGAYVIVASSSSVYGRNMSLPKREDLVPMPASPYAVTKLATEGYANAYRSAFSMETLAFRFFNVYGPGQAANHEYAAVVPAFVDASLHGREAVIYGNGHQTRDFTFVGTVTDALAMALEGRVTSDTPVNLALGSRYSLLELLEHLERVIGRSVARRHLDPRPGDVRDSQADSTALMALFPRLQAIDLSDGLGRTVDWMRSQV